MTTRYTLSEDYAQNFLKYNELIILFDDLDQLPLITRELCIRQINYFLRKHTNKPNSSSTINMVISCRTETFKETGLTLNFNSRICVQYPKQQEIERFYQSAEAGFLLHLHQADSQTDKITPFILSEQYQQFLTQKKNTDHHKVTERAINTLLDNQNYLTSYTREDICRWLIWLDKELKRTDNSVFILDRIQPDCVSPEESKIVTLRPMLASGLIGGGSCGLGAQVALQNENAFIISILFGLMGSAVFWLVGIGDKIEPAECLTWSWSALKQNWTQRLAGTLLLLPIFGYFGSIVGDTKFGTLIAIFVSVGFFLFYQVPGRKLDNLAKNGEGIISGLKYSVLTIFFSSIFISLAINFFYPLHIAIPVASGLASIMGLLNGGHVCLQHFSLRAMLYHKGYAPWKYGSFLEYAEKYSVLVKENSGYRFKNVAIQDYFAQLGRLK